MIRHLVNLASSGATTTQGLQELAKLGASCERPTAITRRLLLNLDAVFVLLPAFANFDEQKTITFASSKIGKTCITALEDGWYLLYEGVQASLEFGGLVGELFSCVIAEYKRMLKQKIHEVIEISDDEEEPPSKKPKLALVLSDNEEEPSDQAAADDASDNDYESWL